MKKITIIEDEAALQDALKKAFSGEGYEITQAFDGEEGISLVKSALPDLVLLDLVLPKKHGFEVLQEMKADETTKNIPVLVLTNLEESTEVMKAIELGARGYLIKANYALKEVIAKEKDIDIAFKRAKELHQKPGDTLVSTGKITESDLERLQSHILGIPFIDLDGEKVEPEVLHIIPEPIARAHNIVAYKKTNRDLEVAMLDPEDLETIEFIKKKSNLNIKPRLTNEASMKYLLGLYQKSLEAEFGEIIKNESDALVTSAIQEAGQEPTQEDLRKVAEELPIIKIVDTLIRHAILQKASDINIEPLEHELIVRYRLDGILHDAMVLPKNIASAVVARVKVLSGLKLDEKRLPQDGRFKIESPDYKFSTRISVLPVYDGEKVVMRLLPENSKGFSQNL